MNIFEDRNDFITDFYGTVKIAYDIVSKIIRKRTDRRNEARMRILQPRFTVEQHANRESTPSG